MRTSMVYALLAVVVGGVGCSGTNSGVQTAYNATLNGNFTVPPDTSTGAASLVVTVSGLSITGNLTISANASSAYSVGHIHAGSAGSNGGVLLNLCGTAAILAAGNNPGQAATPACAVGTIPVSFSVPSSTSLMPGSTSVTWAAFVTSIENGGNYAQVHSATHPGGEIRGQIQRTLQTY